MLVSVVMTKKWEFNKMGIDMSKAFDTIKRQKILDTLSEATCDEDEIRLVRTLLAETTLKIRVNSETSDVFDTSIGSPQGDSLSPTLFTCYLAGALKSLRATSTRPNPPIADNGMPLEMEYADDVDFLDENKPQLVRLQATAATSLKDHNLIMNESKTEFVHIYLADQLDVDSEGKRCRGNEKWRKSKTLGSLLCTTEDIRARCNMGNMAFQAFWKLWKRSKIPIQTKLRLYDAYCTSIMLYNSNSWAATSASIKKLDACHRKHLRTITGHSWPNSLISNKALYKVCKLEPLSNKVNRSRWTMLGHVLRMDRTSPAQQAIEFAINANKRLQGRRGRHCTNLIETIRADVKEAGLGTLRSTTQLNRLRQQAKDRVGWRAKLKDQLPTQDVDRPLR
jgi:hypothetical protein